MPDDRWRDTYDEWKLRSDADEWPDDNEYGCTCPRKFGAGGARMADEWCPLHGRDPDAEYEKMRDDRP
mgnify:CR=1 FL=1